MKVGLAIMLVATLSACAPTMFIAGHTGDYSEVFTGQGVGGPDAHGQYTGIFTGVSCTDYARPTGIMSSEGEVTCSDGRKARMFNTPHKGLFFWQGTGTFNDGLTVQIYASVEPEPIQEYLAKFKQVAEERRAAAASPSRPAATIPAPAPPPRTPVPSAEPPRPKAAPLSLRFARAAERPDDVAVIIGNADYGRQGKDIPDVKPAHADADGARLYATHALGIRDGNVILLKDATGSQMTRVLGSEKDHRGQLFDWVKPGKSRVFVFYSGHGAPGPQGGSPFLVPVDADAARIELNGYPLRQLYDNLGKLPAESVTVVLEACFSGLSPAGSVLGKASPVFFDVKAPPVPANLTVITAGAANQVASWEPDDSHGLFTRNFLEGMAGKADFDKDGKVGLDELDRYLKDTLTYLARRHYGRDQQAQIVKGGMP
ncbi:MAG: caspase family protein [Magnetospirillum sp.]|nr:MAG: caspase family protein [Magnetospirillum sp.]